MTISDTINSFFSVPFPRDRHLAFRNRTYARIPVDSKIWQIFYTFTLSLTKIQISCEVPVLSDNNWFITTDVIYEPQDIVFDSKWKNWHGKKLSEMVELDDLIMATIPEPVEHPFSGRTFIGFLALLDDLTI